MKENKLPLSVVEKHRIINFNTFRLRSMWQLKNFRILILDTVNFVCSHPLHLHL